MEYTIRHIPQSIFEDIQKNYHRMIYAYNYSKYHEDLFDITLSNSTIIKINRGDVTLDLCGEKYIIKSSDYSSLVIK